MLHGCADEEEQSASQTVLESKHRQALNNLNMHAVSNPTLFFQCMYMLDLSISEPSRSG